ncbi:MAG: TetR/AcrR family transcriptional regulator [Epsilonproteobacteria bacterium]|nr:TetR/AcrR family transcriptional regulator [Campylobacterota bacterium]
MKAEVEKLKRELIITESIKYFETNGYEQTKIVEIAKSLNISVGTIYAFFKSKEKLYLQCIMTNINNFYEMLGSHLTDDPKENLKIMLRFKFEFLMRKEKVMKESLEADPLFNQKVSLSEEKPLEKIYLQLEKELQAVIQKPELDYRLTAIAFNRYSDAYLEHWFSHKYDLLGAVDEIIENFLQGVNR